MKTFTHFFNRLLMTVLAFALVGISTVTNGQTVTHPLSGVTTAVQWYSFYYEKNATTGVLIDYFIVEAPNSQIKTCFDACDICWGQYKGFAQLNTFMRCINCGNTYPIDDVGQQGQGNCWPAYLPHTTDANNVILTESALIGGEWMFEPFTIIAGVNQANNMPSDYSIMSQYGQLMINMPGNAERLIHLVGVNGQIMYSTKSSSAKLQIKTNILASGVYVVTIEEGGKVYNKKVWVN